MIIKLPEMMTQGFIKQWECLSNEWDTPNLSLAERENLIRVI